MALIKTKQEIARMRVAGRILAAVLKKLSEHARPGISLASIDALAHRLIVEAGATPSFLGYRPDGASRPYPASVCVSLNDVVVHGVPTARVLKSGDVLKIDLGVRYRGYHADAAVTLSIGYVTAEAERLIAATRDALGRAIILVRPGAHLGDIGFAVAHVARRRGFAVVRGLTGHGIGSALHEEPSVFNEGKKGKGIILRTGMTLAIEPMFCAGTGEIVQREDEGYATADGSIAAHFEHTVLITASGAEVLTVL